MQLERGQRERQDAQEALELERKILAGQLTVLSRQHALEFATAERSWQEQSARQDGRLAEFQSAGTSAMQTAFLLQLGFRNLQPILEQVR